MPKKKMHVIFKTHLDIGFTDLSENVVNNYLNNFIPHAIELGKQNNKFIWTVGSWLIDYYLNEKNHVPEESKKELIQAINNGNISWHGLPVTTHSELADRRLFEYGLSISKRLDEKFGKNTISAKMTDVPGHTIGIVPLMAKFGLEYLHIGVNPSSAIPSVPPMFIWRAPDGKEIIVHYDATYGSAFVREGWDEGIYFAHSNDNCGPPRNVEEITETINKIQKEYPNYQIEISTIDNFAKYVITKRNELPIVTEEIGDTWIHGVASDPLKITDYRILLDLRNKWIKEGSLSTSSLEYARFSNFLLLIPEHTWGTNASLYLPEYKNYLINDFEKSRVENNFNFENMNTSLEYSKLLQSINMYVRDGQAKNKASFSTYENSWDEQRLYLKKAIMTLSDNHRQQAIKKLADKENIIVCNNIHQIDFGKSYHFGEMGCSFDKDGSIEKLYINNRSLIKEGKSIGKLIYEKFDAKDFQNYLSQYSRINEDTGSWVFNDFGKRGIEAISQIKSGLISPFVTSSSKSMNDDLVEVCFQLQFEEADVSLFGLPTNIALTYIFDTKKNSLKVSLIGKNKKANRMPEAYWLECSLNVANSSMWEMHKLGTSLSPYKVVSRGNRQMHSLDQDALSYNAADAEFQISSKYTPVFSFGGKKLLNFDDAVVSLNEGIFNNLYNNVWGTNFPAWYEGTIFAELMLTFSINDVM